MGQPLYCSAVDAGSVGRDAILIAPPTKGDSAREKQRQRNRIKERKRRRERQLGGERGGRGDAGAGFGERASMQQLTKQLIFSHFYRALLSLSRHLH